MDRKSKIENRKSKIALVAPFGLLTKGTTAARVLPIAEGLVELGYEVRVVIPPWDDPAGSADLGLRKPRREVVNGVERVLVPVQPGPQSLRLPYRLAQATLEFEPDVIHVFKPKAFSGLAALLLALRGQPFVLDTDDWEGPGGYNDVNPYSWPQKRLFAWQERDLPRRATGVTVASRTLQTQSWGFGVAPQEVFYLPNGISPAKYAGWHDPARHEEARQWRQKLNLAPDDLVFLAYTRFAEFKPTRLLEIFQAILQELPADLQPQARLLVVGAGFFGEEREFQRMAEVAGLGERLRLAGAVSLTDLPALLRCGDISLYPFDDNLINRARCSAKFLDLLMAERAVVTESVGELPNYLSADDGLLVPPGDTAAFARAVVHLARLPAEERAAMGQRATRRLATDFTWQRLIAGLPGFYGLDKVVE